MKVQIKNFLATEAAKLRGMTFKEKCQYIWEYYKIPIIITAVAIAIILYSIFSNPEETYLYGAWFGHPAHSEQMNLLGDKLSVIVEEENQVVSITSYITTGDFEFDMALTTRFFAMVQAGFISMMFATHEELMAFASQGALMPLEEFMAEAYYINPELHSRLTQRLEVITFQDWYDVYQTQAMGISLEGSPVMAEVGLSTRDLYLAVLVNASNLYRIIAALEVLLP